MTPPNLKIALPPPRLEMMRGLATLSDNDLCYIIGRILAAPGHDFTEEQLDELAAINAEFQRREIIRHATQ